MRTCDLSLSVVMIVKNEEALLGKCLETVKEADEIIILDTGSTDKTKEVAEKYTSDFIEGEYEWCDDFSGARNKAKEYAISNWILSIDADETLEPGGISKLKQDILIAEDTGCDAVDVVMTCSANSYYYPRCFKNDPTILWQGPIHEVPNAKKRSVGSAEITYGYSPAHKKDPNRSLRILEKYVKDNPHCKREFYYLAREYTYKKNWEQAVVWFNRYVKRAIWMPEKADAFYLLAKSYWRLSQGDEAREACLKAILLNPNFKEAIHFMGDIVWPNQKKRWLEMAEGATNEGVLFTRDSEIRHETRKKKALLDFLVLGHPRSGTRYMSELFTAYGFNLQHERYGRYGISSWLFAVNRTEYPQFFWTATRKPSNDPFDRRNDFDYRYVIHVVRHPLKTIASTMYTEDAVPESLYLRRQYTTMYGNPYMVATQSYLGWNKLIKAQDPDLVVRLEEADEKVFDFLVAEDYHNKDADKNLFKMPEEDSNRRQHALIDATTLRANLPEELWRELVAFSNEYGYDLA